MMDKKRFGLFKYKESINLGDEIQSLAAKQYLPEGFKFIDRDYMSEYEGDPLKVIMNGWYMVKPENWPPSPKIDPLFISFHASKSGGADKKIINVRYMDYWKKHEPIGCRDHKTVELFKEIGIDAYYSGCLTLTLPKRNVEKTNRILVVDPFRNNLPEVLVKKYMNQFIPEHEKSNVEWIYQDNNESNVDKRYELAEQMLDTYASAKLVITSRIHCALPCLAFGTPVIFIDSGFRTKHSRDRFSGITDLMNVIGEDVFPYPNTKVKKMFFDIFKPYKYYNVNKNNIQFNWEDLPSNPVDIEPIASKLRLKAENFVTND